MDKILKSFIFIFLSAYFMLEKNVMFIGTIYFYFIITLIAFDLFSTRKISLLTVWNFAFLFIINSEILSPALSKNIFTLSAVRYLVICNNIINLGYLSNSAFHQKIKSSRVFPVPRDSKIVIPILIVLIVYYSIYSAPSAIASFSVGRAAAAEDGDGNFIYGSIVNALGYILPAVAAYYFTYIKKAKIWQPLLFSAPIFIILFLGGTRFPILFSVLGFVIVRQSANKIKLTLKNYVQMSFMVVALLFITDVMKSFRTGGDVNISTIVQKSEQNTNIAQSVSAYFTIEGIVDMTSLMFKHFETKPHLYGTSSSFLLYFWVPRDIWQDKPTMIGYWFIREYRGGFGEGHSASFGFSGDLFADFGVFSVIPIFFLGRLLKTADKLKNQFLNSNTFEVILGAMIFPYVFFFIRSPITSSINFLGVLFFYFLLKKLMFKNVKI